MTARVWLATTWVLSAVLAMLALTDEFMPAALVVQIILLCTQIVAMSIAIKVDRSQWSA